MPGDARLMQLLEELVEHLPSGSHGPHRGQSDDHAMHHDPLHLFIIVVRGHSGHGGRTRLPVMEEPDEDEHEDEE